MIKIRGASLVLLMAIGAGCVELPLIGQHAHAPAGPNPSSKPSRPEPVNPEDVNASNAREKADALQRELDYESHFESSPQKP